MQKKRSIPRIVWIIVLLAAAGAAGLWWWNNSAQASADHISVSGTIETTQVRVSPEVNGVVIELNVAEGQEVKVGDVLAKIDDTTTQIQYSQAQAALQSAQENLALAGSNYALVEANTSQEQRQATISAAEMEVLNAQQALQTLSDNAPVNVAQMQQAIADAAKALDTANQRVNSIEGQSDQADIDRAEAAVVIAEDKLKKAKEDHDRAIRFSNKKVGRALQEIKVADAQTAYDAAVTRLNNLIGQANKYDLAVAHANQVLAETRLADLQRQYDQLVDGIDPNSLALAKARLVATQAKLTALQADPVEKQLAVAQDQIDVAGAQVENAKAQVKALEVQLAKYTIIAPLDGIILSRGAEVGETISPNSVLFEIGDLQRLQLTVYLPEEQFGKVKPGDQARVTTDAYPGRNFTARVDRLSDQAEFTPRNVQTVEGRRDTVYAVHLSLDNADLAIVPGMWADVNFSLK
jgi:HlyD family secretion protein